MAFDRWSLLQLRTAVRRELLDAQGRWWSDAELNSYLDAWQDTVQNELELVWGTATISSSLATHTLSTIGSNISRLDAVYWNGIRLVPKTKRELALLAREQAGASGALPAAPSTPRVVQQEDSTTIEFWPTSATAGTVVFEYPILVDTFATDTSTMQIPAWTRYSAVPFCAYRALRRPGATNDPRRALRYKARFAKALARLRSIYAAFVPPPTATRLRPGGDYEARILSPNR
jgi:hypothetical protein